MGYDSVFRLFLYLHREPTLDEAQAKDTQLVIIALTTFYYEA